MARHKQLRHLLESFFLDAGLSNKPASNTFERERIRHMLNRAYDSLWDAFDWPFKRTDINVPLVPGQRTYDFPREMGIDGVERAFVQYSQTWYPIQRGIDVTMFNTFDTLRRERSDPVQRWDAFGDQQFEVFPVPASPQCIRFSGLLQCIPMVDDNDICLLDEFMVCAAAVSLWQNTRDIGQADKDRFAELAARLFDRERARWSPTEQIYATNGVSPDGGNGDYLGAFYTAVNARHRG